jgi:hypothetical protein
MHDVFDSDLDDEEEEAVDDDKVETGEDLEEKG